MLQVQIKPTTDKSIEPLVDAEDAWLLDAFRWHVTADGYIGGRINRQYVLLHAVVIAPAPIGYRADHINRIRHDCRKDNLRYATHRGNRMNSAVCENSRSIKDLPSGRFQVRIKRGGKHINLGVYDTEAEAEVIRDRWLENEDVTGEYKPHNGQDDRTVELLAPYRFKHLRDMGLG